jgi:hypothetical protein
LYSRRAISRTITAITTKISMSVKALGLDIMFLLLRKPFQTDYRRLPRMQSGVRIIFHDYTGSLWTVQSASGRLFKTQKKLRTERL